MTFDTRVASGDGTDPATPQYVERRNLPQIRTDQSFTLLNPLFEKFACDLEARADGLAQESGFRLKRYRFTRLLVVIFLMGGLLALIYPDFKAFGIDLLYSRMAPFILFMALFFYIADTFLRDYEGALEAGQAAEQLRYESNCARVEWAVADGEEARTQILKRIAAIKVDIPSLMAAEKVGPFSKITSLMGEMSRGLSPRRSPPISSRRTRAS